jgi:hypothetical protein
VRWNLRIVVRLRHGWRSRANRGGSQERGLAPSTLFFSLRRRERRSATFYDFLAGEMIADANSASVAYVVALVLIAAAGGLVGYARRFSD